MKKVNLVLVVICVAVAFGVIAAQERAKREPMTFALDCAGGDCPLLKGAPQTSGMRGGSVKLKPGESVGWHSTSGNEKLWSSCTGAALPISGDIPTWRSRKTCSPTSRPQHGTM